MTSGAGATATPVAAVILAAGRSTRLGRPKAAVPIDGRPALLRLLDTYLGVGLHPVVVVAGAAAAPIVSEAPPAVVVEPGDPDRPMIDSVVRGLKALPMACPGAVVQPVDAPFTRPEILRALIAGNLSCARVPYFEGRPGHPVYLPRDRFAEVLRRPDGGLRTVLTTEVERIEWKTSEILADLDTPEDLVRWGVE